MRNETKWLVLGKIKRTGGEVRNETKWLVLRITEEEEQKER